MKLGKYTIHTQYAVIVDGEGLGGLSCLLTKPARILRIYSVGRNYTSCGKAKYGLDRQHKRLNIWPFSVWY